MSGRVTVVVGGGRVVVVGGIVVVVVLVMISGAVIALVAGIDEIDGDEGVAVHDARTRAVTNAGRLR
jgi:hypothetical protein